MLSRNTKLREVRVQYTCKCEVLLTEISEVKLGGIDGCYEH
jgi:hypothetical protein